MTTPATPMKKESRSEALARTVIDGGFCIGCGACAAFSGSPFKMVMNPQGMMEARLQDDIDGESYNGPAGEVCPFSNQSVDETTLAAERFSKDCPERDDRIGYYLGNYAGYVVEGSFRDKGSSGGFGTWLQSEMLRQGVVDAVIHVRSRTPDATDSRLFQYAIVTDASLVASGAKSRYYPIEMSGVLREARMTKLRFALVGLPCFIKAVQLVRRQDPELAERIPICIGLVCGHLKSARFAESFAWQMGLHPSSLTSFDFRRKLPDKAANRYGIEATGIINGVIETRTQESIKLVGSDWGLDFFKYKACDYCDDVLSETADVTIGDAWLPQYIRDAAGTNILVVRNPTIKAMLESAKAEGRIVLDVLTAQQVAESQGGGLRHRRGGLAYRLYLASQAGIWHPKKRVTARKSHLGFLERRKFRSRMKLRQLSHDAFEEALSAGQIGVFLSRVNPAIRRYYRSLNPWWYRMLQPLKPLLQKLRGKRSS